MGRLERPSLFICGDWFWLLSGFVEALVEVGFCLRTNHGIDAIYHICQRRGDPARAAESERAPIEPMVEAAVLHRSMLLL
jgi:hypothetical protein